MSLNMIAVPIICLCLFQKKSENSEAGENKGKEREDKGRAPEEKPVDRPGYKANSTIVEGSSQSIRNSILPRVSTRQSLIISMAPTTEVGEEVLKVEVKEKTN